MQPHRSSDLNTTLRQFVRQVAATGFCGSYYDLHFVSLCWDF